ncbi:hypothetical protein HMF7854_10950 [Sphingomonas ginkgonis]|uniref:Uncharacterized protein n=1 Tax=Sphingomonas ginkgonis TaxID=2315330 RepID=A0A3S0EN16_9SPHN|nr:hypothetical protein [Sphingomonas ginkgonis]RST31295.1 hypothetical protein HMF7854_10950 [Sphingomonas ginkgonis]
MVDPILPEGIASRAPVLDPRLSPDPHGQAAMLLVESLIHGLIGQSVISVAQAIEIVEIAADVKEEIGADLGDTPDALQKSLNLLNAIRSSLAGGHVE